MYADVTRPELQFGFQKIRNPGMSRDLRHPEYGPVSVGGNAGFGKTLKLTLDVQLKEPTGLCTAKIILVLI
jgi:hypothetical protein